jgi:hypothetical protein
MREEELYHSGVKGMKWGVWNEETRQRYEGKDGPEEKVTNKRYFGEKGNKKRSIRIPNEETLRKTLTQNQKGGKDKPPISSAEKLTKDVQRLNNDTSNIVGNLSRMKKRKIQKAIDAETAEELKGMTDQQLRDKINRMSLERQYSSLKYGDIETGYEKAQDILETVGAVVGIAGGLAAVASTAYTIAKGK